MYMPLYFLIITFALFSVNVQAQDLLASEGYTTDHTLTEDGKFYKDQIVYYTKGGKWMEVTNSSNPDNSSPDGIVCMLMSGASLKIVDFYKEQQIVIVEILNHLSNFSCASGDQFILSINPLSESEPIFAFKD